MKIARGSPTCGEGFTERGFGILILQPRFDLKLVLCLRKTFNIAVSQVDGKFTGLAYCSSRLFG
jgi:hypothetical protein